MSRSQFPYLPGSMVATARTWRPPTPPVTFPRTVSPAWSFNDAGNRQRHHVPVVWLRLPRQPAFDTLPSCNSSCAAGIDPRELPGAQQVPHNAHMINITTKHTMAGDFHYMRCCQQCAGKGAAAVMHTSLRPRTSRLPPASGMPSLSTPCPTL